MASFRPPASAPYLIRALLIEDNPDDSAYFASVVRGCDPATSLAVAETAEEAVRQMEHEKFSPDVVFLDLHLPGLPAREFVSWVRARPRHAGLPIIAVTGFLASAAAGRSEGAHALLVKPVTAPDLAAILALIRAARPKAGTAEPVDAE